MASYSLLRIVFSISLLVRCSLTDNMAFPQDFLLGMSTSSYQIEGAWNENGKGENVWDSWTHNNPNIILDQTNGDIACDSYHRYKEDVQLLKNAGVDFYRFSLSWSRILPNGYANFINQDGLNYYKNLIDELLANNIKPFVTIYHWDHPAIFEEMGGWTNDMMIDWISDYARVVFKELGPKVKLFMTINEPSVICNRGYGTEELAPGAPRRFLCMHNILKAHAKIYHIYKDEFRKEQGGQIGLVMSCLGLFPKTPNDTAAAETYFQYDCGWMANPIFSKTGDYPMVMKVRIAENSKLEGYPRSILPKFTPEWVQYIKGTADFFGLNHYTSRVVETVPRMKEELWYDYSGIKVTVDPSWPTASLDWLKIVPDGLKDAIKRITMEYDRPPIYITENGYTDKLGTIDHERISYLYSYMKAMLSAIHEHGCNVKGYAIWSLLDNFEWKEGYTSRFGVVHVDFADPNRTRTPKLSMNWYSNVTRTRTLQPTFDFSASSTEATTVEIL